MIALESSALGIFHILLNYYVGKLTFSKFSFQHQQKTALSLKPEVPSLTSQVEGRGINLRQLRKSLKTVNQLKFALESSYVWLFITAPFRSSEKQSSAQDWMHDACTGNTCERERDGVEVDRENL